MKKVFLKAVLCAAVAAASASSSAAVIATFGTGSAVKMVTNSANFTANTTLKNNYIEDGLLFSFSGTGNNSGCGYEGFNCYDYPSDLSPAFDGNYMSTNGTDAYISVKKADLSDFYRIEFAAGSGYVSLNGYWRTYNNGVQTGAGGFSKPDGAVLGLVDMAGFDEVRYWAFSAANRTTGFSAPAIDQVAVGVPEPGSLVLFAGAMLGLMGVRRKRS